MSWRLEEGVQAARMMGFLWAGECVATRIARQQARIAPDARSRRFLEQQARQELFHATVFRSAQLRLAPDTPGIAPTLPSLSRYESLVHAAMARGGFDETLIGLQVVLEGLGDVVLSSIDSGLSRRGLGFTRLRRVLREQEHAHHAFGLHLLERRVASGEARVGHLRSAASEYVELADAVLDELTDLFIGFDEDPVQYRVAFVQRIPAWLRSP